MYDVFSRKKSEPQSFPPFPPPVPTHPLPGPVQLARVHIYSPSARVGVHCRTLHAALACSCGLRPRSRTLCAHAHALIHPSRPGLHSPLPGDDSVYTPSDWVRIINLIDSSVSLCWVVASGEFSVSKRDCRTMFAYVSVN